MATGNGERNDYPITNLQILYFTADFFDNSHRFVSQYVTFIEKSTQYLIKVKIRSTDRG